MFGVKELQSSACPPGLTFAGLPITAQAEPGAAPAGPALVAVPKEADIGAASRLAKLVGLTGMAPHCNTEHHRGVLPSPAVHPWAGDTALQPLGCGNGRMDGVALSPLELPARS